MTRNSVIHDFLIIGAGIAGASAAYELIKGGGDVVLCEMESQPGYHTTGRSAAIFTENYGNEVIRALTSASREFLENPPQDFCEHSLLSPRGALFVASEDIRSDLESVMEEAGDPELVRPVDHDEIARLSPLVNERFSCAGAYEKGAADIDVNALLHGYLRGFRRAGGRLVTDAEIIELTRLKSHWLVKTGNGDFLAQTVVNAAGAWADVIADLAGTGQVGLVPKKRTGLTIDPGQSPADWPLTIAADESWYFKPEGGRLMISPADETPSPPCDAQPDEMDIALCIDRIQASTNLSISRLVSKRAGLRSFVADKSMVCGYARDVEGFFWLAGQGGYGIQTSPAMARVAAALARGRDIPADIRDFGVSEEQLAPDRSLLT